LDIGSHLELRTNNLGLSTLQILQIYKFAIYKFL
jgi:hypothetical protein